MLDELWDVVVRPKLRNKAAVTVDQAREFVELVRAQSEVVPISGTPQGCVHPADDKFIETALCGGASVIVSEDKHLLEFYHPDFKVVQSQSFGKVTDISLTPAASGVPTKKVCP